MLQSLIIISMLILSFISGNALANHGVHDDEIILGTSNATSGPAGALGRNLNIGSKVYLDKINAQGGVNGRQIKMLQYDDGYEPLKTIQNTAELIREDKVFALFNYVGTPTSRAAVPIITRAKIPYITPFTGAEFLRNPINKYVVNLRASYYDETEALVDYLVNELKIERIGAFIQDDSYGAAGRAGIARALSHRGLEITGIGKYKRNTVNIQPALDKLKKYNPQAVIMIGAYKPVAEFIKTAKKQGFTPRFLNISFVGTKALIEELGTQGDDVIISQVVPHPTSSKVEIVKQYRADMQAAGIKEYSFGSLEGYINAVFLIKTLKDLGNNLTHEAFIKQVEKTSGNIKGLDIQFSKDRHQGFNDVFITCVKNGEAVELKKNKGH